MAEGTDGPLSRFIPARAPGFDSVSEGSGFELLVHFYIDAAGVGQMTGNPWSSCGACARVRDAVIGFPAHVAWRQVEAATAARDVATGEPCISSDLSCFPSWFPTPA